MRLEAELAAREESVAAFDELRRRLEDSYAANVAELEDLVAARDSEIADLRAEVSDLARLEDSALALQVCLI